MPLNSLISFISWLNHAAATKTLSFSHPYSRRIESFIIFLKRNELISGYAIIEDIQEPYVIIYLRYFNNKVLPTKVIMKSGCSVRTPIQLRQIHKYHHVRQNYYNPLVIIEEGGCFYSSLEMIDFSRGGRFWGYIYV